MQQITPMASEREILDVVAAAVLTSDYVLNPMRWGAMLLAKVGNILNDPRPRFGPQAEFRPPLSVSGPGKMPLREKARAGSLSTRVAGGLHV